jgi:hypothetical protein
MKNQEVTQSHGITEMTNGAVEEYHSPNIMRVLAAHLHLVKRHD